MKLLNQLEKLKMAKPTDYFEDTKKLLQQLAEVHTEIDNVLVRQKDIILNSIQTAKSQADITAVLAQLRVVEELWKALNYEYKFNELTVKLQEVVQKIRHKAAIGVVSPSQQSKLYLPEEQ
jgi:hypothetical protein